ncbi:MAG: heavy-metal-associated domain-containing protein [Verrucomicrobiales bacterium]|nr:heavy-metal-associated domain-containing protein [Verrucomicrobiales bacterium]
MHRITCLLAGIGLVLFLSRAADGVGTAPVSNGTNWFRVTGMHCKGCASGIASELRRTPGVLRADVSLTNGTAVVHLDTNQVSSDSLVRVIREAGYDAVASRP